MIILDTSFLVSFFNEEDALHYRAIDDMKNVEKEGQLTSDYVVFETATVLRYKANLNKASEFLEGMKMKNNLQIQRFDAADFERISAIFNQQKNPIGFIDASVIYQALITGSKIATYDEDILKEVKRISR